MSKRKTKKKKIEKQPVLNIVPAVEIRTDQILLNERTILLFDDIRPKSAYRTVQNLLALDRVSQDPILLCINSSGGIISDGFAIIDGIQGIKSKVITLITGEACSMAGLISIAGDERVMSSTAIWMTHDMSGGIWGDYANKVIDRAKHIEYYQGKMFEFVRKNTKLSEKDIQKAIHGELWLTPKECLEKGVVDKVIGK